jgi:hypothetical protein
VFLTPSAIEKFMMVIENKTGVRSFPFIHTKGYRHMVVVDHDNSFGRGYNAMFSLSGLDKS